MKLSLLALSVFVLDNVLADPISVYDGPLEQGATVSVPSADAAFPTPAPEPIFAAAAIKTTSTKKVATTTKHTTTKPTTIKPTTIKPTTTKPISTTSSAAPTSTLAPPPPPGITTPGIYLLSLFQGLTFKTQFTLDFQGQMDAANAALGAPANSINNTMMLTNFVAYTVSITRPVYQWILADPRVMTLDASTIGGVA